MIAIHIVNSVLSLVLWYYIFGFCKSNTKIQIILCITLLITAITWIFLNLHSFSPFHILSAVTIGTIPIAIYDIYHNKITKWSRGIFFNFLWLNLAFLWALFPSRELWYRLWIRWLGVKYEIASQIMPYIMIIAWLVVIYIVYQIIYKKKYFDDK